MTEPSSQAPRQLPDHVLDQGDKELQMAMAMSQQQLEQDEKLRQQEEEELRKAIELSMQEK